MSFPRYEEYKDSGVEWLPHLPGHWRTGSLRWLSGRFSGGTPDKNTQEYWEDGTIPWLNSGAVNQALITEPSTYITEAAFERSSAKWIPAGALVMALAGQGKTKGMVAQLAIPSTCNQSMAAIVPTAEMNGRFLLWWLQSNYQNIRNMAGGDMRDGLNLDLLGEIPCPIPPPADQATIATFLDRETAKIDALVEEQKHLIELLKEKRQAVISHAVTKGLNPTAPMKDSGVEWLGKVPTHWDVRRVKAASTFLTSGPRGWSDQISEKGALFVQSGDLTETLGIDFNNVKRVVAAEDAESKRTQLKVGDVLVCITGAKTGKVAVCEQIDEPAFINQHICLVRPAASLRSTYLGAYLHSAVGQRYFELAQYGLKQGLSLENVKHAAVPLPPLEEQDHIIDHVRRFACELDDLTEAVTRSIALLNERRTALISAAVTGKIDVRGLAEH